MKCNKCGGNVILIESEMKLKVHSIGEDGFPEELLLPNEPEYKEKNISSFMYCESCNERFEVMLNANPENNYAYDVGTRKDDYREVAILAKAKWKAFWKSKFWDYFLKAAGALSGIAVGIGVFALLVIGIGNIADSITTSEIDSDSVTQQEQMDKAALYSGEYNGTVIELTEEVDGDKNSHIVRIDVEGYDVLNAHDEELYYSLKEGDEVMVKIGELSTLEKVLNGAECYYTIYKGEDDIRLTTLYGGWKGD